LDGTRHVPVAEIPGLRAATKHRAVILLGVFHETGVLLDEKALVAFEHAGGHRLPAQLREHVDNGVLARLPSESLGIRIGLRILTVSIEAAVALARSAGGIRI